MAAQVDVQPGDLARTASRGRLHLSPLTDASNKGLMEIPTINSSHIITLEPNKPVPAPKPRISPKPFAVEKNPSIKPILAPKPQTKPRPESTRLLGYTADPLGTSNPSQASLAGSPLPVSTNPNRPSPTSFKTVHVGPTVKPGGQGFKPVPPPDSGDPNKASPLPAERQKSLRPSKSFKRYPAAEWPGTTRVEDESKSGTSITRAKSMGYLLEVGKGDEKIEKAQPEASVQLRPTPRSYRPRPVSSIFPASSSPAEAPVPAPRWTVRRPLSTDLTSKFESIGLSLHQKSPKENPGEHAKVNTPDARETDPAVQTPLDQSNNKKEKVAEKEADEDKRGVSIKSRISLLLDSSSSPGASAISHGSDPQTSSEPAPETETPVGVKQLIKQLTVDTTPTQSPVMKPAVKPRPLPFDLTKRFSSERPSDLVSFTEAADHFEINKDAQMRAEESELTHNAQRTVDLEELLTFGDSSKENSARTSDGVQTVRASLFDSFVEKQNVRVKDIGSTVNTSKDAHNSPSLREDEYTLFVATYKEPMSPSGPLPVLHTFDTVPMVEENKAITEIVPLAQWENKALTLRSKGNRPQVEKAGPIGQPTWSVTTEQPRYLRVGALPKWSTSGLDPYLGLEKGMPHEPQRENPMTFDKDGDLQNVAEPGDVTASPKRLKMLTDEEQPKPRATYFALTGQMQETSSFGDVAIAPVSVTTPASGVPEKSLPTRINPMLSETFDKSFQAGIEEMTRGHLSAREIVEIEKQRIKDKRGREELERIRQMALEQEMLRIKNLEKEKQREMGHSLASNEQTKKERIEAEKKRELQKQTERHMTKLKELEREKQSHLEFARMKEMEMQREAERQRQKAFEKQKKEQERQQQQAEFEKFKLQEQLEKDGKQKVREMEKLIEQEKQRLQELEREKQKEVEKEKQRHLERERRREAEKMQEREKQQEKERQRQKEEERQKELDKEHRLLEIQKEKQKFDELERIKEQERQQLLEFQKQKQAEKERQELIEYEKQRLREKKEREEAEKTKQMAIEQEMLRMRELDKERERQRVLEREQQKEIERKKQRMEEERQQLLELQKQKQREKERQQMMELEKERLREKREKQEAEKIKQMALEHEILRIREIEKEREKQREMERNHQKEIEREQQRELEQQRLRSLERERQRQLDMEQQKMENQRLRQQEQQREKQRLDELERLKEIERRQLLEFEKQKQVDRDRQHLLELEKSRLDEKMVREEADKMRQIAKQQEAERQRLKEKQRKEEQERLKLQASVLRPQVLDLDYVLRSDPLAKGLPPRSDPTTWWKEPYKPAILDIDSFSSTSQHSPAHDVFTKPILPSFDAEFGSWLQPTQERDVSWKVPAHATGGFQSPKWTTAPQDPWELQPVGQSVDKAITEPKTHGNHLGPEQLLQDDWLRHPPRLRDPSYPFLGTHPEAAQSPSGQSISTTAEQIWLPQELQRRDSRKDTQDQRRSQGSQELNRIRSRSVSRRSAPPGTLTEGNLSRVRSRSAHREQDGHSWVQKKQSGEEGKEESRASETAVGDNDSQYGTWDTGLRTDDSLTPATPSTDSKSTSPHTLPGDAASQAEADTVDGRPPSSSESQPLLFPDTPTALLDTSALRSRAQLGKKRAPRTRPSRAARQAGAEGGATEDWLYRDSTAEAKPESQDKESDSEEQARAADAGPTVSFQPQRVALFPNVDPLALKVQLKKRVDSDNQNQGDPSASSPSPSQTSRSPRSPFLPRAARVLPPAGRKDSGEEDSPQWLKELKSKKRLSQYENDS